VDYNDYVNVGSDKSECGHQDNYANSSDDTSDDGDQDEDFTLTAETTSAAHDQLRQSRRLLAKS
jgi:hypothetical protein